MAKPKETAKQKDQPESVTLTSPYGYIGEDGRTRYWNAGAVVTHPEEIADLLARKAPLAE